jgi:hypothetical protein
MLTIQNKFLLTENPNTPIKILEILATDEDYDVRYGVAGNPNTPANALEQLATDEYPGVRYKAAMNSSATEIVKRLFLMTESEYS